MTRCYAIPAARRSFIVAEAETFIYASRAEGPAQSRIFRIKEAVPLAALPATKTQCVLDAIHPAYPQFIDGVDVLHTGLEQHGRYLSSGHLHPECGLD